MPGAKQHTLLFLAVLLAFATAGCKETGPAEVRIDTRSGEVMETTGPSASADGTDAGMVQKIGPNAKVVGGEPAAVSEDREDEQSAEDAKTAEDKTGAVAVKMEY